MKTIPFEKLENEFYGEIGTPKRDAYEAELQVELLALKLREERKRKKITQEELGKKIGVKKSYISSIENAKRNVSIEVLTRIAHALGVGIDYTLYPLK
ncbi:MAG: helix-turn-helix domain-containing protein [Bacteroidales bacterium]